MCRTASVSRIGKSYTFKGENDNVMLELSLLQRENRSTCILQRRFIVMADKFTLLFRKENEKHNHAAFLYTRAD